MSALGTEGRSKSTVLRTVIVFFAILVVGVMAFRIMGKMRKAPKKKSNAQALSFNVKAKAVRYQPQTLYLSGFGTAEANRRLDIVPEVSGKIVYTLRPFKVGKFVRRGQRLLVIDRSNYSLEYKRLKAQVESLAKQIAIADRAYKVSRRNLGRSKRLVRKKALDYGSYERSEQMVLDRSQRLESLRQALKVNKIMLSRAALQLRRTIIRAPFNARVSRGNLTRGSFVSMGRAIGALESTDAVEIPVSFTLKALYQFLKRDNRQIPLQDIPKYLSSFPPVQVSAGGVTWEGRVVRTGPNIDRSTRTLTLFIQVDLRKKRRVGSLLPGTFCQVKIPSRRLRRAVWLPRGAVYGNSVYVEENGKLQKRNVKIAYLDGEKVLIADGIEEGIKVITSPLTDPIIGTRIYIR